MNDNELFELINLRLDGEITAEEDARLQRQLEDDPEARKTYEQMAAISNSFNKVPEVDPPAGIKAAVMRDVDARLRSAHTGAGIGDHVRGFWQWLTAAPIRPRMAFAGGLAVGLVVLIVGLTVLNQPGLDHSRLVGSILPPETLQQFHRVSQIPVQGEGITGEIESAADGDHVAIKITLQAENPVAFDLIYDATDYAFRGLSNWQETTGPITITSGHIAVTGLNQDAYTILLQRLRASAGDPQVIIHTGRRDMPYQVSF